MTPLPALSRKGRGSNHTGSCGGSHDPEARLRGSHEPALAISGSLSPRGRGLGRGAGINPTPRSRRRPALFTPLPALSRKGKGSNYNPPPMGLMVLGDHGCYCLRLTHEGASRTKAPAVGVDLRILGEHPLEASSASATLPSVRYATDIIRGRIRFTSSVMVPARGRTRDRGHFFGSGMTRSSRPAGAGPTPGRASSPCPGSSTPGAGTRSARRTSRPP